MPKLAANLSMMFSEVDFLDRFAAAASCGFRAVEYLFPYAHSRDDLAARLSAYGLRQVLFNVAEGDWDKGERGIGGLPGREDEFRRAIETGLAYAGALGCPRLHVMSGLVPARTDPARCRDVLVANLRWAADAAATADVTLLLEPLNPQDFPGYLIATPQAACAVIADVGAANIKLQYDFYHQQMTLGRLVDTMKSHWGAIGHMQISGVPGRYEPDDNQEIDYRFVLAEIDSLGYDGWVGCEYRPRGRTEAGLGWAEPYGLSGRAT